MTERDEMVALADRIGRAFEIAHGKQKFTSEDAGYASITKAFYPKDAKLIQDALRSAARTDAGYGVKPLEWRDHSFHGSHLWIATTPFDDYRITKEDAEWPYVVRPFRTPQSNYQTIEEAKADCEADYEQRIRSAIAALPAPGGIMPIPQLEPWRDELSEIIGHLGSAVTQSVPSDDQIIMDHVKAAHEIAKIVRRKA